MRIVRYQNPDVYQEALLPTLVEHEAENNLPLGILSNLISGEFQEVEPYLAAVFDGSQLELAVMRTPPFPVLFSYRKHEPEPAVLDLVVEDLWSVYGPALKGMTGNKILVSRLVERWQTRAGVQAELKMAMRIYRLKEIQPVEEVSGEFRRLTPEDRDLLLGWLKDFHQEALQEEAGPEHIERQVNRFLNADPAQRGLVFWVVDGKPVSMAGYSGPTPNGIRIGAVYTPTENRRKGYASAVVTALSQRLLDYGFDFCFLFTDLLNPTSNAIYQRLGYRPVVDVDTFHFS